MTLKRYMRNKFLVSLSRPRPFKLNHVTQVLLGQSLQLLPRHQIRGRMWSGTVWNKIDFGIFRQDGKDLQILWITYCENDHHKDFKQTEDVQPEVVIKYSKSVLLPRILEYHKHVLTLSCSFLQVENTDKEDLKIMKIMTRTIQIPVTKDTTQSTNHKGNVIDELRQIYNKFVFSFPILVLMQSDWIFDVVWLQSDWIFDVA